MRLPAPGQSETVVLPGGAVGQLGKPVLCFADRNELHGHKLSAEPRPGARRLNKTKRARISR